MTLDSHTTARVQKTCNPNLPVPALVDRWARSNPSSVALIATDGESLSYGQLVGKANQLAHHLVQAGVNQGDRVGVCLSRSVQAVIAFLAVWKAGGAYVPIDPAYPTKRVEFMLTDAEIDITIDADYLHKHADNISAAPLTNPAVRVSSRDLAYVMYTSGSTGIPKGVEIEHRSIVNLVQEIDYVRLECSSRVLHAASISFDAATWEIWVALTNGKTLVVAPHGPLSSTQLSRILQSYCITHLFLTTSLFHRQVEEDPQSISALRTLVVGGEAMNSVHAVKALQAAPGLRLVNGYGPTEATTFSVMHTMDVVEDVGTPVPIGQPTANTRAVLLDDSGQLVPVGNEGELYLGGPGLARGYHERPELTAQRFISDPFSTDPTARLYRTGDLACWLPDGTLEFRGRLDNQVKLNGFRIELGEIENALLQHPDIKESVVVHRRSRRGSPFLAAYYTTAEAGGQTPTGLRFYLADLLPPYMLPTTYTHLPAIPLTVNGKTDIDGLPEPKRTREIGAAPGVPPKSPLERKIASLWSSILDADEVGIEDTFTSWGGDSLGAMRIASTIYRDHGISVTLNSLLDGGTVSRLVTLIEENQRAESQVHPLLASQQGKPILASAGQQGLWIDEQSKNPHPIYNEVLALRISGSVNFSALQTSLTELSKRHEALRSGLAILSDKLHHVVSHEVAPELTTEDLSSCTDLQVTMRVTELARLPLDLEQCRPLRAILLRLSENQHLLVIVMHHAMMDGWSANVIFADLSALYTSTVDGTEVPLPPVPVQFSEYVEWQERQLQRGAFDTELQYWLGQLQGAGLTTDLPTDFPRPTQLSGAGRLVRTAVPRELVEQIETLACRFGVTRYSVFLSVFQVLLSYCTGEQDVVTATATAGRADPRLEHTVGYFINTMPIRTQLDHQVPFKDLLKQVHRTVISAYDNQDIPFSKVLQALRSRGQECSSMNVALVPEDVYSHSFAFDAKSEAQFEYFDIGISKIDLTVYLIPDPQEGGLRINAEYSTDLFQETTIQLLLQRFVGLLRQVVDNDHAKIADLSVLRSGEEAQVCGGFDGKSTSFPSNSGVPEIFTQWVEKRPGAVALASDGGSLTYAELDKRSNQLAHFLANQGAESGKHIGVLLPRGTDAILSFLAVLKTGAAYVPLDPAYPAERRAFMIQDAGLDLVITSSLLNDNEAAISACPQTALLTSWYGEQTACILYTSGSMGRPKGVEVRHRSIIDLILCADYAELNSETHFLHSASISFDMAVMEIWTPLLLGGRLVVSSHDSLTAPYLRRLIEDCNLTDAVLPTAVFHRLVEEDLQCFDGLRSLMVGGERLGPSHAAMALQAHPDLRLVNGYGPTETLCYSAYQVLSRTDEISSAVPIGRPSANTRARVLNRHGKPVPIGVPGELCLGGPGLFAGYLNQPDLTAKSFAEDPTDPAQLLYRTGDLVRWNTNGTLSFEGRLDEQFKLGGYRIEPGEIENVMIGHDQVISACVTKKEEGVGGPYLAAYYIARESVPPHELMSLVTSQLPAYMVPQVFMQLESFPVTANGKIDRVALPIPPVDETHTRATNTDRSAYKEIAQIWRTVLVKTDIDEDGRLFDLGGGSLHATQIHHKVAQRFSIADLRLADLYVHSTLRGYVAHVEALLRRHGVD
ncbi:amino acid adenylation domain-containing protein [Streptomyces chartreusis]|uniref:amino acid adenylation domain-containing protein n=1 Tax=Streptomyces chartreusis TaxID=1969 RepID=UPI0036ABB07A